MKPTTKVLENLNRNSNRNHDEVFTRLYRYLLRPDLYHIAYSNLYANKGAATIGVNDDTADGFSEAKVEGVIKRLGDGTYQPHPVRREYIPKKSGSKKMRPLGIPTFTDKLVQEVLRMVLESVYEPVFTDESHGFRPKRGCFTALMQIKKGFNGVRWFIEGDIKGCFDNIDHQTLLSIIGKKIKDARFLQLIGKFLKAGYLEKWQYHNTYSGTPQGGIVSPILANIYLHELDKFIAETSQQFEKPRTRVFTPEYSRLSHEIHFLRQKIGKAQDEDLRADLLKELKRKQAQQRLTPCSSQTDKVMKYVRYADDFIIGVKGSKEDCEAIKAQIREFIAQSLHMELSEEKTLITHSDDYARFLGYDIRNRRNDQVKVARPGVKGRTLNNTVEMNIPLQGKVEAFLIQKGVAHKADRGNGLVPQKRNNLLSLSALEIVNSYNAEIRGICNYYSLASNYGCLNYFTYLMTYSCLHTLACKHKSTINGIIERYKDGKGGWAIPYETRDGKKRMYLCKHSDCKKPEFMVDVYPMDTLRYRHTPSTFETRLKAKMCELCGCTDSTLFEVHHVRRLKDLKGKAFWEVVMIGKRRKTMVVCKNCHDKIHGSKSN